MAQGFRGSEFRGLGFTAKGFMGLGPSGFKGQYATVQGLRFKGLGFRV